MTNQPQTMTVDENLKWRLESLRGSLFDIGKGGYAGTIADALASIEAWSKVANSQQALTNLARADVKKLRAELAAAKLANHRLTAERDAAVEEAGRLRTACAPLAAAARGLSHGTDWNKGTHAKLHGYRAKLLKALPVAEAALSPPEGNHHD